MPLVYKQLPMTPIETINDEHDHDDETAKIVSIDILDYHKQTNSLDFASRNRESFDTPTIDLNDNNYTE